MSDWYFLVLDRNAGATNLAAAQSLARNMADAIPGDANFDGAVNSDDFNVLATNFGTSGKWWGRGDFNFDGLVNSDDFNLLATNFGLSGGLTSVPEPATGVGGILAFGVLGLRRCRKSE
jgi:hypothetical protein